MMNLDFGGMGSLLDSRVRDCPSGALMVAREDRIRDVVERQLIRFPETKGDDRLLRMRADWAIARASGLRIGWTEFQVLRALPSPETYTRRRRELQGEQRERVRARIFAEHPEYGKEELDNALEVALGGDLSRYGEKHNIQPTTRTRAKRARKEAALRHHYGKGLTLEDFADGDDGNG